MTVEVGVSVGVAVGGRRPRVEVGAVVGVEVEVGVVVGVADGVAVAVRVGVKEGTGEWVAVAVGGTRFIGGSGVMAGKDTLEATRFDGIRGIKNHTTAMTTNRGTGNIHQAKYALPISAPQ